MDTIRVGQITNADIYLNDNRLLGRVKEFEVPEFKYKIVQHEALGMIGMAELPSRAVEALKGKINFDYIDSELDSQMINPTKVHYWTMRTRVDIFDAQGLNRDKTHRRVMTIGAMFEQSSALKLKLGENTNREIQVSVISLVDKVSTQDVPLLEFDLFNNILRINGEDVWPD